VHEFVDHLIRPSSLTLTSCGRKIDRLGDFTESGEDVRATKGVLLEEHTARLQRLRINTSWRPRGNKGEKNTEDKELSLSPQAPKRGSSAFPLAPSSKIGHFRKYCYSGDLCWCHTMAPLHSKEWNRIIPKFK